MCRQLISSLILSLIVTAAVAQKNGEVNGILLDNTGNPLPFATATIYRAADTSLIDYVLTEDNGSFNFKRLPLDQTMRIIIS